MKNIISGILRFVGACTAAALSLVIAIPLAVLGLIAMIPYTVVDLVVTTLLKSFECFVEDETSDGKTKYY